MNAEIFFENSVFPLFHSFSVSRVISLPKGKPRHTGPYWFSTQALHHKRAPQTHALRSTYRWSVRLGQSIGSVFLQRHSSNSIHQNVFYFHSEFCSNSALSTVLLLLLWTKSPLGDQYSVLILKDHSVMAFLNHGRWRGCRTLKEIMNDNPRRLELNHSSSNLPFLLPSTSLLLWIIISFVSICLSSHSGSHSFFIHSFMFSFMYILMFIFVFALHISFPTTLPLPRCGTSLFV